MYLFENIVDWLALAPGIPPAFDNPFVVAIDGEVSWFLLVATEETDKTFKANSLCPPDIAFSIQGFPSWNESPSSPSALYDDGNANT